MNDFRKKSKALLFWHGFIFLAIAFSAFETPVGIALKLAQGSIFRPILDSCISFFFALDIAYAYRHHYYLPRNKKNPEGSSHPRLLLCLDIFSSLPFDLFAVLFGLPPAFKFFRLFRAYRMYKIVGNYAKVGNLTVFPMPVKIGLAGLFAAIGVSCISCLWILVHPHEGDTFTQYNRAMYFVMTTLTTIGYGDITPGTNLARCFTMVIQVFGVALFGLVIGNITKMIEKAEKHKDQSKDKIHDLHIFMKHYQIPSHVQKATFDYYHNLYSQRITENDDQIIGDLPSALRDELQMYMNVKLISSIPLFPKNHPQCLEDVARALEQKHFSPGQTIIKTGEIGHEMFIIAHGMLDVEMGGNVVAQLTEGQCFGEAALLEDTKRNADVKAQSYCDLYKLSRESFTEITTRHPELYYNMLQVHEERKKSRDIKPDK